MRQILLKFVLILSCLFLYKTSVTAQDDFVNINFESVNTINEIKFISKTPMNAAIFLKQNKLWFAIDKRIDINRLDWRQVEMIKDVSIVEQKGQYVIGFFEITDPSSYEISSCRKKDKLIISIVPFDNSVLSDELPIKRKITKNLGIKDNSIDIAINSSKKDIVKFIDPFTGEELLIIPELISARTESKAFVDFAIIDSLSGLVIKNFNDSLRVTIQDNYLKISSTTYLNIGSSQMFTDNSLKSTTLKFDNNADVILDLTNYNSKPGDFQRLLSKNYSMINNACDSSIKGEAFLNLSLFFLANKWYSESESILELVNRNSDIIANHYEIMLFVAATYFMSDSFDNANNIISAIDLKNVPIEHRSEISLWQSICRLMINDNLLSDKETTTLNLSKTLNKLLDYKTNFLKYYNSDIFNKICFKVAEIAIKIERFDILRGVLMPLSKSKLDIQDKKRLDYLRGKLLAYNNNDQAIVKFTNCMKDASDRYFYSKCKFEALNIMYNLGKITKIDYINNLQGLSTVWRGDDFEFQVLDRLANVYQETNNSADTIRTWKIIANNYPGSYNALISTTKAGQAFIDYFNTSNASKLERLGFFYEFQDFIPLGDEGDEIIMQTASYMLDLDIVEHAIKIIEYQIKNRLIGISRENVINDLINIYLNINKSDLAEKTVESFSRIPLNIEHPIIAERRYLYIQALINSNQIQDAIAMLYGDIHPKADELRAKAFFKLEDWELFNDNSEPYLYSIRYDKNSNLSDNDYVKILKQNISYFTSNQMQLMNDLYLDMKPRFKKGQKNAERNRLFYHIANELNDGTEMTSSKKSRIQNLITQITNS